MTRVKKKTAERQILNSVLTALRLKPDREPDPCEEKPDFTVLLAGRAIGFEVTLFQSGAQAGNKAQRKIEAEWERLLDASRAFQAKHPDLRDVNVILTFKDFLPSGPEHQTFMEEIRAFVRQHAVELSPEGIGFWKPAFSLPLMAKYLQRLDLRTGKGAEWASSTTAGWLGGPDPALVRVVKEKSAKTYRPADELWLAIQCGAHLSEMIMLLPDNIVSPMVAFEAVPCLTETLRHSRFAKAFFLLYQGTFEWNRTAGWRKLPPDLS